MKKQLNKYYIALFCFCANVSLFAQPGSGDGSGGGLEGGDPPAAPINDSLWVLILVALIFAFIKYNYNLKRGNANQ